MQKFNKYGKRSSEATIKEISDIIMINSGCSSGYDPKNTMKRDIMVPANPNSLLLCIEQILKRNKEITISIIGMPKAIAMRRKSLNGYSGLLATFVKMELG